jgi:hypothetical protein
MLRNTLGTHWEFDGNNKNPKNSTPTPSPLPQRGIFTNIRCPPNIPGNFSQYFL